MPVMEGENGAASGKMKMMSVIDYDVDGDGRRLESSELRELCEVAGAGEVTGADGEILGGIPDSDRLMKPPRAVGLQPTAAVKDIMDGRSERIDDGRGKRKRSSGGGWRRLAKMKRLHTSADTADQARIDVLLFAH